MQYFIDPATGQDYAYDDDAPPEVIQEGLVAAPPRPSARSVWQGGQWHAAPVAVPDTVTPLQIRLALRQMGNLARLKTAVAASGEVTQLQWEYATVITRTGPIVQALATALTLTPAQLDALFTLAATL